MRFIMKFNLQLIALFNTALAVRASVANDVVNNANRVFKKPAEIGVSFSPAGLMTPFHIGACAQLREYGVIKSTTAVAGSSGGALAAATAALEISPDAAIDACCKVAMRCRDEGTRGTLRRALDDALLDIIPVNSGEALNQRDASCIISYMQLLPTMQPCLVDEFSDNDDLLACLRASCNIPLYFNGNNPFVRVRGKLYRIVNGLVIIV